jgi:flagellar biosynthesis/type III secretory pathway M-ring protein FliF/YscJ
MDNFWVGALWAVTPTVLLGLIFWLIIRSIIRADRTERNVYARMEAKERQRRGSEQDDPDVNGVAHQLILRGLAATST